MSLLIRLFTLGQARNEWLDQAAVAYHVDKADIAFGRSHTIMSKVHMSQHVSAAELASQHGIESDMYIDFCIEKGITFYTLELHKELHP